IFGTSRRAGGDASFSCNLWSIDPSRVGVGSLMASLSIRLNRNQRRQIHQASRIDLRSSLVAHAWGGFGSPSQTELAATSSQNTSWAQITPPFPSPGLCRRRRRPGQRCMRLYRSSQEVDTLYDDLRREL